LRHKTRCLEASNGLDDLCSWCSELVWFSHATAIGALPGERAPGGRRETSEQESTPIAVLGTVNEQRSVRPSRDLGIPVLTVKVSGYTPMVIESQRPLPTTPATHRRLPARRLTTWRPTNSPLGSGCGGFKRLTLRRTAGMPRRRRAIRNGRLRRTEAGCQRGTRGLHSHE
jgi:hypothetical protein